MLTTADSAMIIDKANQDKDAAVAYTKAEADARFTLISVYEAKIKELENKIADLERRIKALESGQTTAEPTAEPELVGEGLSLKNVTLAENLDLSGKAEFNETALKIK